MLSRRSFLMLSAGLPCLPLACSSGPDDVTLQGSGATFPAPLYKRWFLEFYKQHPNVRINYQGIGLLIYNAAQSKDFPMLMAGVLTVGVVYALATLAADLLLIALSPRLRTAAVGNPGTEPKGGGAA